MKFKQRIDSVIKLFPNFMNFLNCFLKGKLPPHRFYDHKIKFIKKKPKHGFLYSMSHREFQIWKKKIDENLAKVLSKPVHFEQQFRFYLLKNREKNPFMRKL